jgi:cell division septation protein DedD
MASGNIKKMELKLGRTGIIIVVVGMTALLCSVFMLGVHIGKNIDTYPEKIASIPQKALALIWRPAKTTATTDIVDNKQGEGQTKAGDSLDLTFYNTLTSKKGVVKDQPLTEKKMVETPPPQTDLPQLKGEEKETTGGNGLETQMQPAKVNEKADDNNKRVVNKVETNVTAGKQTFIIQAASLKEKAKAYQMIKNLSDMGYKSHVVKIDIKGKGTWFRVIVSGFDERARAQVAADKIAKKMKTKCIIRRVDADKKIK